MLVEPVEDRRIDVDHRQPPDRRGDVRLQDRAVRDQRRGRTFVTTDVLVDEFGERHLLGLGCCGLHDRQRLGVGDESGELAPRVALAALDLACDVPMLAGDPIRPELCAQLPHPGAALTQRTSRYGPVMDWRPAGIRGNDTKCALTCCDVVGRQGLEPCTLGLKVPCSTR